MVETAEEGSLDDASRALYWPRDQAVLGQRRNQSAQQVNKVKHPLCLPTGIVMSMLIAVCSGDSLVASPRRRAADQFPKRAGARRRGSFAQVVDRAWERHAPDGLQ